MSQPVIRVEIVVGSEHRNVTPFDVAEAMRQFAAMIDKDVMFLDVATDPLTQIRIPDAWASMQRTPPPAIYAGEISD